MIDNYERHLIPYLALHGRARGVFPESKKIDPDIPYPEPVVIQCQSSVPET